MVKDKPKILKKETYLKMIGNSIGSKLFNSIIAIDNGVEKDILNDGQVSCAVFVSNILFLNGLLSKQRATINSLENDLLSLPQFQQISEVNYKPEKGDMVIWESIKFNSGSEHRHIGFILNSKEAVSTDYREKCVVKHDIYRNTEDSTKIRKIEKVFRYRF